MKKEKVLDLGYDIIQEIHNDIASDYELFVSCYEGITLDGIFMSALGIFLDRLETKMTEEEEEIELDD